MRIQSVYVSLGMTIAASAQNQMEWPFVTVPAFEAQATLARQQSGASTIGLSHVVRPEQVSEWNNWTVVHQTAWLSESYVYQGKDTSTLDPIVGHIWGDWLDPSPLRQPYGDYNFFLPLWQSSPAVTGSIASTNMDSLHLDGFPTDFERMMEMDGPMMGAAWNLDNSPRSGGDWGEDWPLSFVTVPIYNQVRRDRGTVELAAVMTSSLPWHNFFLHLLPDGIDELTLMISSTDEACDETLSYLSLIHI